MVCGQGAAAFFVFILLHKVVHQVVDYHLLTRIYKLQHSIMFLS